MRKLIYYVALTLDGFIADDDGSADGFPFSDEYAADLFASFPETFPGPFRKDEGTRADNKWFDAVVMGRKTYEVGVRVGITSPYPTLDQYVFSRTMKETPDEQVELVLGDAVEVVRALKSGPGKAIWLCGGANIAATLFSADLIDELIVKLNPVLFGSGIPLFERGIAQTSLKLTDHKIYSTGHVLLHYSVTP
jgi:dihydrofolate reductase